jgi:prolyl-tRNA editing enzyme YbaK/EbsC (Cys-tRNA(Pro) deacylase)
MSPSTPSDHLSAQAGITALSAYLTKHGAPHEIIEHAPTETAAAEARAAAVSPDQAAKTIVLHDHGAYLLALIPACERLDLHKLRDVLGATKTLHLATEPEIARHFVPFEVGATPPVGVGVFAGEVIDKRLADRTAIVCSGGDHRHAVRVDPRDVVRLANAAVADICAD